MRRRDFLAASAAAAASLALPRRARAGLWGGAPDSKAEALLLPEGVRAENVLEVFLYGGLGPFETFYVVEEYGTPSDPDYPRQQWYLYEDDHEQVFDRCGVGSDPWLDPYALDDLGMQVKLGPLVMPLRRRKDLLARMRVLVQYHDLEPHETAIPLALTGNRLGTPRLAGVGASVQRYFQERDATGRRIPFSYVLYPVSEISTDNVRAASAVGLHPGSTRPLDLRIQSQSDLPERLARGSVGEFRAEYDALVAHYAEQARRRYTLPDGRLLRGRALDDYGYMTEALANADALRSVFTDEVLANVGGQSCDDSAGTDTTAMGLKLATHLLTHPEAPARHVTVVDGGLIPATGGGGYDVHDFHLPDTARNLLSMLTSLVSVINEPGEGDPAKIDLDRTLVVLNTEFGRTPVGQEGTYLGTNHHPYGYVTILLGGPVGEGQAGLVGAIGPDGWASSHVTPAESRAAVLAAMGIYPFAPESFAIGDLRDISHEADGLAWLNEVVLGRPR